MKNIDYIIQLPIDKLSKLLVQIEMIDDGDYDYEDNFESFYVEYYKSLDGYLYQTKDDCINANINWLNKEYNGIDII